MSQKQLPNRFFGTLCVMSPVLLTQIAAHAERLQGEMEQSETYTAEFEYVDGWFETPGEDEAENSEADADSQVTFVSGGGSLSGLVVGVCSTSASATPDSPNTGVGCGAFSIATLTARRVCTWENEPGTPSQLTWQDTWGWTQSPVPPAEAEQMVGTYVRFGVTEFYSEAGFIVNSGSASTGSLTFTISGELLSYSEAGDITGGSLYGGSASAVATRYFTLN